MAVPCWLLLLPLRPQSSWCPAQHRPQPRADTKKKEGIVCLVSTAEEIDNQEFIPRCFSRPLPSVQSKAAGTHFGWRSGGDAKLGLFQCPSSPGNICSISSFSNHFCPQPTAPKQQPLREGGDTSHPTPSPEGFAPDSGLLDDPFYSSMFSGTGEELQEQEETSLVLFCPSEAAQCSISTGKDLVH